MHVEGIQPSHVIDGTQTAPVVTATPAPAVAARPPRVWPAFAALALFWGYFIGCDWMELTTGVKFFSRIGAVALLTLVFLVWWWANRRISLADKLLGFTAAVLSGAAANFLYHKSVAGFGLIFWPWPVVLTAWAAWVALTRNAPARVRRLGLVAVLVLTWAPFGLIRTEGIDGEQHAEVHWRWTPTPEQLALAEIAQDNSAPSAPLPAVDATLSPGDWPGFRGPNRDSVVRGVRINADWKASPPRPLWRHRVGPGWSSVAVVGGRLFTQEQRGEQEAVVCYEAATGKPVWVHEDQLRFWDSVSGAGPRATPTFADGRLYTLGGTGLLNCLDAATGKREWSRDIAAEAPAKAPLWGFSSSPLVAEGVVIAYAGGDSQRQLLAYRADSGEPAWAAPAGGGSYSSPQLATLGGKPQVLFLGDRGVSAYAAATGQVLWEHSAPVPGAPRSLQPQALGDGQVLFASEMDIGVALLDVRRDGESWAASQLWASREMKPSFDDFVVHQGHAYGFDGAMFCCLDLGTGARRWKGGRYGHGQVLLLADQGLLLVTSEKGEAILLKANPERLEELGRFQAVNGKTWNHSVVAHGRLFVRNGEEMACYELAPER
jgi:outer membrane protein assembly factor BamB